MQNLIKCILTIAAAISVVAILYTGSRAPKGNGFRRRFENISYHAASVVKLPSRSFFFGEKVKDEIILKDNSRPWLIFSFDYGLHHQKISALKLPENFTGKSDKVSIQIHSPYIYLHNKSTHDFIIMDESSSLIERADFKKLTFDQYCTQGIRVIYTRSSKYIHGEKMRMLVKLPLSGATASDIFSILPMQENGYSNTDGLLYFDEANSNLFYLYYYIGTYLVLDTNLNIVLKAKTIDTIHRSEIKVHSYITKLKDGSMLKSTTQLGINNMVSRTFAVDSAQIYIVSDLKADNQSLSKFSKSETIDVYNIKSGLYKGSFYLPKVNNQKIRQIQIHGSSLYALCGDQLVFFEPDHT